MPNVSLRSYIWQSKTSDERAKRGLWSGNGGATYEGYRNYIMQVKEQGWPEAPAEIEIQPEIQPDDDSEQGKSSNSAAAVAAVEAGVVRLSTTGTADSEAMAAVDSPKFSGRSLLGSGRTTTSPLGGLSPSDTPPSSATAADAAAASAAASRHTDYQLLHTFHPTQQPVSLVKFARCSSELLAFGGHDGAVYVASAADPPRLLQVLERHTGRVTDLDWSHDNTFLLSSSDDGTVCLWLAEMGALVRVFRNAAGAVLSCRFHPVNPTTLFLGTAFGEVLVMNSSTGKMTSKVMLRPMHMAGVGAACLECAPNLLLVADTSSTVHLYDCSLHDGRLAPMQLLSRTALPTGEAHEVACLEFVPHSAMAGGAAVLLIDSTSTIVLYRLRERQRKHWLETKVLGRMPTASCKVRGSMAPTASQDQPEALLMGGEEGLVQLLDLAHLSSRGKRPAVMGQLAGHGAPVVDAVWSYDESLLASCDRSGAVLLWRKCTPADVFFSDSFDAEA